MWASGAGDRDNNGKRKKKEVKSHLGRGPHLRLELGDVIALVQSPLSQALPVIHPARRRRRRRRRRLRRRGPGPAFLGPPISDPRRRSHHGMSVTGTSPPGNGVRIIPVGELLAVGLGLFSARATAVARLRRSGGTLFPARAAAGTGTGTASAATFGRETGLDAGRRRAHRGDLVHHPPGFLHRLAAGGAGHSAAATAAAAAARAARASTDRRRHSRCSGIFSPGIAATAACGKGRRVAVAAAAPVLADGVAAEPPCQRAVCSRQRGQLFAAAARRPGRRGRQRGTSHRHEVGRRHGRRGRRRRRRRSIPRRAKRAVFLGVRAAAARHPRRPPVPIERFERLVVLLRAQAGGGQTRPRRRDSAGPPRGQDKASQNFPAEQKQTPPPAPDCRANIKQQHNRRWQLYRHDDARRLSAVRPPCASLVPYALLRRG